MNKVVDEVDNMIYDDCAIKGFDRSNIAAMREGKKARVFKNGIRFSKAKVLLSKFRFIEHVTNAALKASGFFVAVLPTIFSVLVSAAGKNRLKSFKRQQGTCINPAKEIRTCE